MRRCLRGTVLLLCLAALVGTGCDQRPIDIVPMDIRGSWRVLPLDLQGSYDEIAGVSATEVYAAHRWSGLMTYDGVDWTETEGAPFDRIADIFASPSLGVYILTNDKIFRRDGGSWTEIYTHEGGWMWEMWVSSPTDIHIGASNGMVHFDGTEWLVQPGTEEFDAHDIWGASPSDVFAVGEGGMIAHYDGDEWTVARYDYTHGFIAVWGSGPSDVHAATRFSVWHYDGQEWIQMEVPPEIYEIQDIWGTSAENVFVLYGDYHLEGRGIARFDGGGWEAMASNTVCELNSIWGSGPDDVYAVGAYGKIVHFDGIEWRSVSGGAPEYSRFITGIDDQNVYLGNAYSIFRFDGSGYDELPHAADGLETVDLWALAPDMLVSVGGSGKVYRFDGVRWTRMASPSDQDLLAVSGMDGDAMVAVGENNTILSWDGGEWSLLGPESEWGGITWRDVWMAGRDEFYVVGDGGLVGRYHDGEWKYYRLDTDLLLSVWGASPDDVIVGGQEGIFRFNGVRWARMQYPDYYEHTHYTEHLHSLVGTDMSNVYISDNFGALYHFDGNIWSPVRYEEIRWGVDVIWLSPGGRLYCPDEFGEYLYEFSE